MRRALYSAVQGERQLPGQAAEPYHLQHDGDQLLAANTASGRMVTLAVSGDGRSLRDDAQNRSNLLNLKIDVVYLVVLYQHQYQLFQALRTNTIASASLLPGVPLC